MDSSFFFTYVGVAVGFFMLFGTPIFLIYRKFRSHQESKDLASSSSPSSSSSSSSPTSSKWTHDVFSSFRGEDVRRNFLSHIQKEFHRKGITPFIDNDIKRGKSIGHELIQAIRRSKVAVVLLSRNYASSKWCLEELAEIMKCKKEFGQTVFAIFYEVDPSDVKKLTGEFGAVFKKTCAGKTKEDIQRWRQTFAEVATIAGYDSRNRENEAVMIEEIVAEISKRLINSTPSSDFEGLIGMGAHIEAMKRLLCLGSYEVRMIGIWGTPGIGKTTIARFLYDKISDGFELSVFMKMKPCFGRQTSSDDHDVKLHLEQQLLSQLTNQKDLEISHLGVAQHLLMNKKVLVVLDGVDQLVQLLAMPKARCLGPGTRIIITTQDLKVLKAFGFEHIYEVNLPIYNEALQIFSMSAFGQNAPYVGFEYLARQVTNLVGCLPLGLRVMGSHLRGMSKEEWKKELPRLRFHLDGEIGSILKLSYDALGEEDKLLFLYITCFFVEEGLNDNIFEDVLRHKFSNVSQGLNVLVQRSLVSMDSHKYYSMHDLLVQLGREIVRNQSIDEPGKRQFLVDAKDICEVLTDNTGSRSVIGINLDISKFEDDLYLGERVFEEMSNLQLFRIHHGYFHHARLHLPQGLNYLPPKLRILHWDDYPLKCLPSDYDLKFLVKIEMKNSELEKLSEGIQLLGNLKLMDLSDSKRLKDLPDLSTATKLEDLKLNNCSSLVEIPSSIEKLTSLGVLNLDGCSSLLKLPSSIGNLTNIYELHLSDCSSLVDLPSSIGNLSDLKILNLGGCSSLVKIPSSVGNLQRLERLNLQRCSKLEVLPININLGSLNYLYVTGCSQLRSFPEISTNIKELRLCGTLIDEVPLSINSWSKLRYLALPYCKNLGDFPNILNMIVKLEFNNTEIEEIPPWFSEISLLHELVFNKCRNLVSLPQLPEFLTSLVVENCDSLERLACSFPILDIHLRFANCWKLNKEARDIIIKTSSRGTVVLPGREVHVFFTYRAISGGPLTVKKLNQRYLSVMACILLVNKGDKGACDEENVYVSCNIMDKRRVTSNGQHRQIINLCVSLPNPLLEEHLYTFKIRAENVESRELLFEFKLDSHKWEIAECGIRELQEKDPYVSDFSFCKGYINFKTR